MIQLESFYTGHAMKGDRKEQRKPETVKTRVRHGQQREGCSGSKKITGRGGSIRQYPKNHGQGQER